MTWRAVLRARRGGPTALAAARSRGQSMVEFAMVVPVFLLLLLGMLEFGFAFSHNQTLEYATREGSRTGAALAGGSSTLACSVSPDIDKYIVAAVERVLTSPGSLVTLSQVSTIKIYDADGSGNQISNYVNAWNYTTTGSYNVDGKTLHYMPATDGWYACTRDNGAAPDSLGVSLSYTYNLVTPLGGIMRFFGGSAWSTLPMGDRTVMALEPTQ